MTGPQIVTAISTGVLLQHRCNVQRNAGATDSHGGTEQSWQDHLANQPCIGWIAGGSEIVHEGSPDYVVEVESRQLVLPLGTDVTQLDRIGDVSDRYGNLILAGPHVIESIFVYPDRLELSLLKVGG